MAAYVIQQKNGQAWVRLKGDLTALLIPELRLRLREMLGQGIREVVFDLARTAMVDSSGIGLLIATDNSLSSGGGKVRVTNAGAEIFRLLRSMRLTARLNVSERPE